MDSQLASVLTSGSLDVQNGSHGGEGSGPVTEAFLDHKKNTSPCAVPGNLQPCPVTAALTIRADAPSINGKKLEVGGTSKPAFQETRSKIAGLRQPITVKTGVPVVRNQPIRLKIVVPPQCKKPITNSAISLTKNFPSSHFTRPFPLSAEELKHTISADKSEEEIQGVSHQNIDNAKTQSFHEKEREEKTWKQKEDVSGEIIQNTRSETHLIPCTNMEKILIHKKIKEENTEKEIRENSPLILQEIDLKSCKPLDLCGMEGQTEPLDLSLPKKRDRKCGAILDDSGCESSLIMEVDEYEGEGDRDVVEEDDGCRGENTAQHMDGTEIFADSMLSNSFFDSFSSVDCDTEDILLIDDQGIPYTLGPDGLKVQQVDTSTSEDPPSDLACSAEVEETKWSQLTDASIGPSVGKILNESSGDPSPSPALDTDSLSLPIDQTMTKKEAFTSLITKSDPSGSAELSVKPVQDFSSVESASAGISLPTQPVQILTNPSTNTPIFFLSASSSPQISSAPGGLSLPLSVTQTSPGASTSMFILLSSVPSTSSGDSASTSTPIAVLDPSTGQLSQITAASAPAVSLPLPCGQLGSPLPTLSHPIIRLSPNNPPVILSGVNNISSGSVLTSMSIQSSSPAPQHEPHCTTPLLLTQISSSESNPGSEAISAEEISNENNKPSTSESSAKTTSDHLAQPSSETQSPAPEPKYDPPDAHSQHLPLDDHLYFSNAAAPPSPPIASILSSIQDPLDPLDPLSSEESSNNMGARRVLYCQLCPRVFFYLSDLERHAITHSQKKPHVCQQCGKAFKRSSHLQRHKHIHTGQRNFVCPICSKRFREAGELQRHQRVHTGEKPYQCQLCHTRFAERNTLRRHTKRKHPYHQVAMEMLNERRAGGLSEGGGGEGSRAQEEEESAEWYSSTVSNLENSESEMET